MYTFTTVYGEMLYDQTISRSDCKRYDGVATISLWPEPDSKHFSGRTFNVDAILHPDYLSKAANLFLSQAIRRTPVS